VGMSLPNEFTIDEIGMFLAEYATWLWGCGSTCVRAKKNVTRIAEAYGYDVDLNVMPKHVSVTLSKPCYGRSEVFTHKISECGINFSLNAELSALSWNIRDVKQTLASAELKFRRIISANYSNDGKILVLASLANASFCRLFGGDSVSMAVVFFATFAGLMLKHWLLRCKVDNRVVFFLCAFVSSVLSAGAILFGWGDTPDIALATSVLYLIPGVPYINSASDFLDKHYLCSFSRFLDALALTASLSAGMCLGLGLMGMSIVK